MNLKLVCEPIILKKNEKWLEKEIGICIPFGRKYLTTNKDRTFVIQQIVSYIKQNPPILTSLRFTNIEGGEPSYVKVSPTLQRQDEKVWDLIYRLWPQLIRKLTGIGNVCYFNAYNILTSDYSSHLPQEYNGRIIKSPDPDMPALIECTESFLDLAKQKPYEVFKGSDIWYYNTLGYILPKDKEYKLKEWVEASKCTDETVKDFFETLVSYFEVKYEKEGVWIVSHKLDWRAIYSLLEVDKVNESLKAQ